MLSPFQCLTKVYAQVLKGFNTCNIHNTRFDLIPIMWYRFVDDMA